MTDVTERQDGTLATDAQIDPQHPPSIAPQNLRRFQVVAGSAVVAAGVPYLWVLWDLWSGTVDPLRTSAPRTAAASVIYDVQARALLHGHMSLPRGSIGWEAFIHDGRTYTYFGIFPSLLRMPILLFTHSLDGRLTSLSILASWVVTALFSTLLLWRVRTVLRGEASLGWPEAISYGALVFSILAGSVLVFLASTTNVYGEDEAWSVALACGSLFALVGVVERPSWGRVTTCGVLVLLTNLDRGTTGYACILATMLVAAWFALGRAGPERKQWAFPVLLAGLVALVVGCAIDFARFDLLFGYPVSEQLNYQAFGWSKVNGGHVFSLHFLPTTLVTYLSPENLRITPVFPYLALPALQPVIAHTSLFNSGNSSSVPASMPLLFALGMWGVITSFGPHRPMIVRSFRILLFAAAASAGAMLVYGAIYERFLGDFMALLILASVIGLVDIWCRLDHKRRSVRILVPGIGVLALFGFVANMGIAIGPQGGWSQTQLAHYVQAVRDFGDITGQPGLSGYLVRANYFVSRAPMDQLFIEGRCRALYIADQAVPNGYSNPWLLVERAPHTPLCDSLVARATNVSLGTSIVSPHGKETVSGSHVVVTATTSGVDKVSTVSFELVGHSSFAVTILGTGTRTHAGWTYVWDSRSTSNGTYSLLSVVENTAGYTASGPPVTITVHNPAKS